MAASQAPLRSPPPEVGNGMPCVAKKAKMGMHGRHVDLPSSCTFPAHYDGIVNVTFDPEIGASRYHRFQGAYFFTPCDLSTCPKEGYGEVFE